MIVAKLIDDLKEERAQAELKCTEAQNAIGLHDSGMCFFLYFFIPFFFCLFVCLLVDRSTVTK